MRSVLLFADDEFSQQVDLNVRPVYLLLKYAGRAMVQKGSGSVVAISSTASAFSAALSRFVQTRGRLQSTNSSRLRRTNWVRLASG